MVLINARASLIGKYNQQLSVQYSLPEVQHMQQQTAGDLKTAALSSNVKTQHKHMMAVHTVV